MELSGPGVQYIADNQLYNSIITAHAILMSAPLRSNQAPLQKATSKEHGRIKGCQVGGVELHEETQTMKLAVTGWNWTDSQILGRHPYLMCTTFRLTNLLHNVLHNWNFAKSECRANVLTPLILSLVLVVCSKVNSTPRREERCYARNRVQHAPFGKCGITYGYVIPNNAVMCGRSKVNPLLSGDGGIVVPRSIEVGRVLALNQSVRSLTSKAGRDSSPIRGSDVKEIHSENTVNIKSISNLKNLVAAYELIKSNPGNMTRGVSKDTLDGISLDYLKRIQSELRGGTFKFGPARRIHIPKPGKSSSRPLSIASPREKIVQKAMQLVMEPVYENTFLDSSHGFRPNRGSRTIVRYIDAKFQSSKYIIEADFAQAFPSIPHDKLLSLLKEKISCEKTLALVKSGLNAGFVELGKLHETSDLGTPQGSILSPLLSNIFLHQLDEFMEGIAAKYKVGTRRKRTKEYMALQNKLKY